MRKPRVVHVSVPVTELTKIRQLALADGTNAVVSALDELIVRFTPEAINPRRRLDGRRATGDGASIKPGMGVWIAVPAAECGLADQTWVPVDDSVAEIDGETVRMSSGHAALSQDCFVQKNECWRACASANEREATSAEAQARALRDWSLRIRRALVRERVRILELALLGDAADQRAE